MISSTSSANAEVKELTIEQADPIIGIFLPKFAIADIPFAKVAKNPF